MSPSAASQTVKRRRLSVSSSRSIGGTVASTRPLPESRVSTKRAFMSGQGRSASNQTVTPTTPGRPSNSGGGSIGAEGETLDS